MNKKEFYNAFNAIFEDLCGLIDQVFEDEEA